MHDDITGRPIDVGDIIVYTATAGQRVSALNFGRVSRMSPKSVWVVPHNPDLSVTMVDDGYMQNTGESTTYGSRTYYHKKFVKTGLTPATEEIITAPRADRLYIVQKV